MRLLTGFAALVVLTSAACTDTAIVAADLGQRFAASAADDDAPETADAPTHKNGITQFKDPGVYADGVPVGMMTFGELPAPLEVAWHEERAPVAFKAGDPGPRFRIVQQRRYRFVDYFRAIGVDVDRIKELHIYGNQRRVAAVIVSGDDLRQHPEFTFRFGSDVGGKPIPVCPIGVGDGKCPDSIGSVALYLDKRPPTRQGGYFFLDGKKVADIPYYGPPLRGGVRVYLDGRLVTTIKRNVLQASVKPTLSAAGEDHYSLFGFLASQGVDTKKIVEAWVIHHDRRVRRLGRDELVDATFAAGAAHKGEVQLGKDRIPTQALALHSRALEPDELPVILPEEDAANL